MTPLTPPLPDEEPFAVRGSPLGWLARIPTFRSLRYRDYAYHWSATFFAGLAQWMQQIAVGWLAWEQSQSPLLVGLATAVRFLPIFVATPLGGVLSDRFDKRSVIQGSQVFLALITLVFAAMVSMEAVLIWHIFVFSFVIGCGVQFNRSARQAMVGSLVPRSSYPNAFALQSLSVNLTRTIGPAVGGALIALSGNAANFFILAGLYVVVFAMMVPIRTRAGRKARLEPQETIITELSEGVRYLRRDPLLLSVILMSFSSAFFVQPVIQIMPAVAVDVLGGGPGVLGLLLSSYAVGGVLASLSIASFKTLQRRSIWLMGSLMPQSVALIAFSQCSTLWLAFAVMAVLGFFQMSFGVNNLTQTQMLAREDMRGRVASFYATNNAFQPLGAALMGGLAELVGLQRGLLFTGLLGLVFALVLTKRYAQVSA